MKGEFNGIFVPLITPFKENGEIDFDGFENILNFLIPKVQGFFVNATTGEFTSLTLKERKRIMVFVKEVTGKDVRLLANVSSTSFEEVKEFINLAKELEYDAIVSPPPFYLIPDKEGIKDYFFSIARISEMGTIIYNIPSCTGYSISVDLIRELALSEEKIIGVKATIDSLSYIKDLILKVKKEREDFSVLTGLGFYLSSTLILGGDGGILALSHIAPDTLKSIIKNFEEGNLSSFRKNTEFITRLSDIYRFGTSFASSIKIALKLMGFPISTYVRKPLVVDDEEATLNIERILKELKIID